MKQQLNQVQKLQKIAGILKENKELNLQENTLVDLALKLHDKALDNLEVDADTLEDIIDTIIRSNGPVKTSPIGGITFQSLNDKQLAGVVKFLKAVNKRGHLEFNEIWDGVKITSEEDDDNY